MLASAWPSLVTDVSLIRRLVQSFGADAIVNFKTLFPDST